MAMAGRLTNSATLFASLIALVSTPISFSMQTEKGDLIQKARAGEFDVIVHGCNCFCTMGAGIAKTIKQVFPAAYLADLEPLPATRQSWAPTPPRRST